MSKVVHFQEHFHHKFSIQYYYLRNISF